jgi:hypothetical protein
MPMKESDDQSVPFSTAVVSPESDASFFVDLAPVYRVLKKEFIPSLTSL